VQSKVEENLCVYLHLRHCEARSAVAIQTAVQFSGTTKQAERPSGLPRACGPRNDELEGERIGFALVLRLADFFSTLDCTQCAAAGGLMPMLMTLLYFTCQYAA
jgi:hypothetical protein